MDPDAALQAFFDALDDLIHTGIEAWDFFEDEFEPVIDAAQNLSEWLDKGGFNPDWEKATKKFIYYVRGLTL